MKTTKKWITALLAICMAISLFSGVGSAAEVVAGGSCGGTGDGSNLQWSLDTDGTLTITGEGPMANYSTGTAAPWAAYAEQCKQLVLDYGVTAIGAYAFCKLSALRGSLTIPGTVREIGPYAFAWCSGLTGPLTIGAGVETIGSNAFMNCEGLHCTLILPSRLRTIGEQAFYGCGRLQGPVEIPADVEQIGTFAFSGCSGLDAFYFYGEAPKQPLSLPEGAIIHATPEAKSWIDSEYYDRFEGTWNGYSLLDFEEQPLTGVAGFRDVKAGAYYVTPVMWAVRRTITDGTGPDTFSPDRACTRGQMVTFLWRAAGCPEPQNSENPFTDVNVGGYYGKAVLWAYENGIVNGITATTFRPDNTVTRGQMATILHRYAGGGAAEGRNPFKDVKQGSFYYNAVLWAARQGITTGTTAAKFNPDGPCTRAQIVTFLYRYFVEPAHVAPDGPYELDFWTFQALHVEFMQKMVDMWNEKNPDEPIRLNPTVFDFEDMHTKLGLCLERGEGAPDMVDIEIGKIHNFLQGNIRLEPLNDIVEPELDNIVDARVDIYAKGGKYYGICYHTGAAVMYYNTELCQKAGIDWRSIDTWDEYYAAGEKLKKAFPDKYWSSVESSDIWHMWGQLAELGGDMTDKYGNITIDTPEMAKVLEYNRAMVDAGLAVIAPGTYHHAEEFFSLMDAGKVASVAMPFWYIDRFPYYMPDLQGKIATRPLPVWEEGEPRSVGQGGTATSITNQAKDMDLVKRFLSYAKLSVDGNIQAWYLCGFDPIRTDVWEMEEVTHADNVFTQYYATNPFDALVEIKDQIVAHNNNENLPDALDAMKTNVLYRAYTEPNVDIPAMLAEEQAKLG